ncbi:NAD(P)-binding protein [Mytilinidion resinicola]|uniref:NAD(P)-binding protein n=1 Tax=Mytilinidion resinicola TaxID=574789 RepID=A0A6A6Y052_9PEZI|nr:NAD(P)-binding protein [Mytilinidion resinicola]KAF2801893.1 NAD(P)-binding protein [Mytilinidion resinicola]
MSQTKYTSKLSQKLILVLGGTSGVGFCVAEACLEHGAAVFISSSNPARLAAALARLRASYPSLAANITGATCDLADLDNVEANLTALFDAVTDNKAKKIDHVVFTAGDALKLPAMAEATPAVVLAPANVRFIGAIMVAKLIPTYMTLTPASSFTLTSGSITQKPFPGWSIIAGWGGAVEGLARGLAVDLAPLRVNTVTLGVVQTELFDSSPAEMIEHAVEGWKQATLVKEIGRPEDVAEAYLYCMRDRFVSGATVETNGGRLLV